MIFMVCRFVLGSFLSPRSLAKLWKWRETLLVSLEASRVAAIGGGYAV